MTDGRNIDRLERAVRAAHRDRQPPPFRPDWQAAVMRDIRGGAAGASEFALAAVADTVIRRAAIAAALAGIIWVMSTDMPRHATGIDLAALLDEPVAEGFAP
jgi:hypothetical protein